MNAGIGPAPAARAGKGRTLNGTGLVDPFTLLSGMTTPVENMPIVLQYFTLINPLRYAIDIIHRIYLEAAGLGSLVPELWPLAIISAVTLLAASWMFRNRLG